MVNYMFKNREVKNYTIKYIVGFILFGIFMFFIVRTAISHMEELYYQELTKAAADLNVLEESGKTHYLPSQYDNNIRSSIGYIYGVVYLIYLLFAVFGYIMGLYLYKIPMSAIEKVSLNSYEVLEGNYRYLEAADMTEGDISRFYSLYTKMVTAIRHSRDKEQNEKIFLQDLIADISHQLKTPLATLTIYQDLLYNPNVADSKKQEILKLMGEQLSRMEWLILSLLKLARLESGAIQFSMKYQPLLPTLQTAHQNVSILLNAKHQSLILKCSENISLKHDSDWLAEALTNILKNATEYVPSGSSIELTVEHSKVMTTINIKDYGNGIDREVLPKIFKRFYRAKSDVNENSIGIGLSLSKGIIEGQGGDITVSSEVGKYTLFTICFYHTLI